jgi:ferredoxin
MVKRQIIKIDEDVCTGCGDCIPNCPEGALQIIDDKARIISDLFCDGLGACIGHCPVDAISIEEREAEEYDEKKVMENVVKQGENVIKAHLVHLKEHGQTEYFNQAVDYLKENHIENPLEVEEHGHHPQKEDAMACGCPGTAVMDFREEKKEESVKNEAKLPCGCPGSAVMDFRNEQDCEVKSIKESVPEGMKEEKPVPKSVSQLKQWPVQLMLVPPSAPYLKDADLLIAADCVPFAYPDFHEDFLKEKVLLVGCPKLDDADYYKEKITQILKENPVTSVTVIHMEVPCCFGMVNIVKTAIDASGKDIPYSETTISVKGDIKEE